MLSSLSLAQCAKKDFSFTTLRLSLAFISRCCISFTNAMCKKGLSFSPLRLSLAFISIWCLLFYQYKMQKEDLSLTPLRLSLQYTSRPCLLFPNAICKTEELSYTLLRLSLAFMTRCCLLFYQCEVQKRRLILHSSSTLFGVYGQMLSSFLSVQYAKKKTYPALLFDSLLRLYPNVLYQFQVQKRRLTLHYSSTLVGVYI
jgi:hypothetical protein